MTLLVGELVNKKINEKNRVLHGSSCKEGEM